MNKKNIWSLIIICIILFAFISVDWEANSIHANGFETIQKILYASITPSLSVIPKALSAAVVTIVYAITGLSIAILFGFSISLVAAGLITPLKKLNRLAMSLLVGMRAIHELVWALFFVASIGLKPLSAVLAIAIPYGGMLGKVYTNIWADVDGHKIAALKQTGASQMQIICFGYIPEAYGHLTSYTLYRLECAIRSSSILSFVGLGGLGLKIQLSLGDLKYHETFTYVYTLVLVVLVIDIWGNLHRKNKHKDKITGKIMMCSIGIAWFYVGFIDRAFFDSIFTLKNFNYSMTFIKQLLGIHHASPAFFDFSEIKTVIQLSIETLQMSILAITLSSIGMILTAIFATRQYSKYIVYFVLRASYLLSRAIPELIWAMIIIFVVKPGIWAGALALAIHNYGILSKLCAEVIEDLDEKPLMNLRSSGASQLQLLLFGVIPSSITKIIGYIIYRWEIILRTTLVVGFIGAGGLGYYFKINMSWFHYTHVTLVLICYFILVKFTDIIGSKLTRLYT